MASVSIVIPSFRQPRSLGRAIDGCLKQDFFDLEVIVVDDHSLDRSVAVAASRATHDPRVRVLARRTAGGVGRVLNCGLEASAGRYVMFLDADCCLLPGAVTALCEALDGCDGDDIVGAFGDWRESAEREVAQGGVASTRDPIELARQNFAGGNLFAGSAVMVRRGALQAVGGFAEGFPILEDVLAWVRLVAEGGRFVRVPRVVVEYPQRPDGDVDEDAPLSAIATSIDRWWEQRDRAGDATEGSIAGLRPELLRSGSRSVLSMFHTNGLSSAAQPGNVDFTSGEDISSLARATSLALDRTIDDLRGVIEDVDEFQKSAGLLRRSPVGEGPFDLVLVPTSSESALEAIAAQAGLADSGRSIAIGVRRPAVLEHIWPILEGRGPVIQIADLDDAEQFVVVMASDESWAQHLKRHRPSWTVALRTSGIACFRNPSPRASTRFHGIDRVLARSATEEVGIENHLPAVVPSGVRFGIEQLQLVGTREGARVVYVPDACVAGPALDTWLSIARRVAGATHAVEVMAEPAALGRLHQYGVGEIELAVLAGASAAIIPLNDAGSLIEALDVPVVYFDPSLSHSDWAGEWLRSQRIARTESELSDTLASLDPTELHRRRSPSRSADHRPGSVELWAEELESALRPR